MNHFEPEAGCKPLEQSWYQSELPRPQPVGSCPWVWLAFPPSSHASLQSDSSRKGHHHHQNPDYHHQKWKWTLCSCARHTCGVVLFTRVVLFYLRRKYIFILFRDSLHDLPWPPTCPPAQPIHWAIQDVWNWLKIHRSFGLAVKVLDCRPWGLQFKPVKCRIAELATP